MSIELRLGIAEEILSLLNIVCDAYGEYQVEVTQPLRTPSTILLASPAANPVKIHKE
jgi:hypothetical protein